MIEIAKNVAVKAWKRVLEIYNWDFETQIKDDQSPLTIADLESNDIIINWLKSTNIAILSEELKDDLSRLDEEYLWIIDPLDWTKEFINKNWEFSVMIWLVKNWEPILWVVYIPVKDKLYYAEKWKWSFLINKWIEKKINIDKQNNNILVSRSHLSDIEKDLINELWLNKIPCWSAWIKCGRIAEWEAWNYLTLYNKFKEWDTCAPEIILTEAWGKVTDIEWKKLKYNKKNAFQNWFVGTNWVNHDIILEKIKK